MLNKIKNSLALIDEFFRETETEYWLEAGTALSAHRDGVVFPWEHDIDVAIWRSDVPSLDKLINFFDANGYEVVVQKGFPFLDNIIQLKTKPESGDSLFDVDIYLYTRMGGYAYMRWIQKPEGTFGKIKQKTIFVLKNLYNPQTEKWSRVSSLIPGSIIGLLFRKYLAFHLNTSTCIYHRFPERYFLNLKKISFYGMQVNIPKDTNGFLVHRYGEHWQVPDSQFNQSGKWKASNARVKLKMSLLPPPKYYKQT